MNIYIYTQYIYIHTITQYIYTVIQYIYIYSNSVYIYTVCIYIYTYTPGGGDSPGGGGLGYFYVNVTQGECDNLLTHLTWSLMLAENSQIPWTKLSWSQKDLRKTYRCPSISECYFQTQKMCISEFQWGKEKHIKMKRLDRMLCTSTSTHQKKVHKY